MASIYADWEEGGREGGSEGGREGYVSTLLVMGPGS
jgi:hypothetical protein